MKKSECSEEQWLAYKAYQAKWRKENIERERERMRLAYHDPERKAKAKAYREQPEVRERKNAMARAKFAAKRAASLKPFTPEQHAARMERQRISRTGMTDDVVQQVLEMQGGCCAICGKPLQDRKQARADHCHDTGQPRGVLCHYCNVTEGVIRRIGLSPVEFGNRLAHYLANPPFKQFQE